MSQRTLSRPGVSYAYLSRIESGQRAPSLKALRLLAPALGVTADYLETGQAISGPDLRELRVSDAELELRLGRDLEKAAAAFQAEVGEGEAELPLAARAQVGLGLLAARRGDHAEAVRLLEAAVASGHVPPEWRPDAYEALGRCYVAAGRALSAINLFESCLEQVQARLPDDPALPARFGTYLAAAHSSLGAIDQARRALATATDAALATPAPQARTQVYWVEAVTAWMDGDSEAGLAHMRRAIGLLEAGEDALQLARAHMVAARMLNLDERHEEAEAHLARAGRLFALGGEPSDLGCLRAESAKVAAAQGDAETALAFAREAIALFGDDADYRSNGWHALAVAHAAAGDIAEAERHFKLALDELEERQQWREAAQVARQWSTLLRTQDRAEDAYRLMERAMLLVIRNKGQEAVRARDAV